jgi:hypothetical protein
MYLTRPVRMAYQYEISTMKNITYNRCLHILPCYEKRTTTVRSPDKVRKIRTVDKFIQKVTVFRRLEFAYSDDRARSSCRHNPFVEQASGNAWIARI